MNSPERNEMPKKKFNVVDAAIIVIVVLLIAGVAWKLFSASQAATEEANQNEQIEAYEELPHILYTVECLSVPTGAVENIENTDKLQLFNGEQLLAAYITDCTSEPLTDLVTNADGTSYTVENQRLSKMTFTVEAVYDQETFDKNNIYKVGTQELRLGKSYILKTETIELTGYVTSMEAVNE